MLLHLKFSGPKDIVGVLGMAVSVCQRSLLVTVVQPAVALGALCIADRSHNVCGS